MGERETAKFLPFSRPRLPPPAVQCELAQREKEKKTVEKKLSNHEKDKVSDVRQLVKVCFESSSGHHG